MGGRLHESSPHAVLRVIGRGLPTAAGITMRYLILGPEVGLQINLGSNIINVGGDLIPQNLPSRNFENV